MCGIWYYLTKTSNINDARNKYATYYNKLIPRGPDKTRITEVNNTLSVFYRLAINDLSDDACMPFESDGIYLICNGEIYNHKELERLYSFKPKTTCDCEVILHLYKMFYNKYNNNKYNTNDKRSNHNMYNKYKYFAKLICQQIDGEFAFILYDSNNKILIASRDDYGVRPLFIGIKKNFYDSLVSTNEYDEIIFSSELKGINDGEYHTQQFKSGHYIVIDTEKLKIIDYSLYRRDILEYKPIHFTENNCKRILKNIRQKLEKAVEKRIKNTDRTVACLLSGGLDSSLICAIASKYFESYTLETYSIGVEGSPDLIAAQKVADHIKSKHTNIIITEQEMLDAIPEVIKTIESYDITTVRASTVNYLLAHYISQHSDAKVILSGEYSDEVFLSYIYCKYIKDPKLFYEEEARLINEIQFFDSLRADRCISSASLEARVPFSDKDFINYIMSIEPNLKLPIHYNNIEKYLLRKAFDDNEKTLPNEILWRTKEAFSDGVSKKTKSWYEIIQEHVETQISDKEFNENKDKYTHIQIPSKEAYYYVKIFKQHYHNEAIIPYYWLPKKINENNQLVNFTNEPSARILQDIYE
jgi:asparagine synthase (glutamine-hydrolysing)